MLFRSFETKKIKEAEPDTLTVNLKEVEEFGLQNNYPLYFAEYCCLLLTVSNYMIPRNRVVFHGVAFIYGKSAFLLTAPSGTGKSTQFRNLKDLYGDRCRIINGDKPILHFKPGNKVMVCPSPWNGKENWRGYEGAMLRGIFCLEQGKQNHISVMEKSDAVIPIMRQFLFLPGDAESVHTVCRMEECLLENIPVFHFVNKGDFASSSMLFDVVRRLEKGCQ